jgi:hypothetical protein
MISSVEKTSIILIYLFSFAGLIHGTYSMLNVIFINIDIFIQTESQKKGRN